MGYLIETLLREEKQLMGKKEDLQEKVPNFFRKIKRVGKNVRTNLGRMKKVIQRHGGIVNTLKAAAKEAGEERAFNKALTTGSGPSIFGSKSILPKSGDPLWKEWKKIKKIK